MVKRHAMTDTRTLRQGSRFTDRARKRSSALRSITSATSCPPIGLRDSSPRSVICWTSGSPRAEGRLIRRASKQTPGVDHCVGALAMGPQNLAER
jgi:hypothetical protein